MQAVFSMVLFMLCIFNAPLLMASVKPIDYQSYQEKVKPIVWSMTLDEKLGQMVLPKFAMLQQGDKVNFKLIQQYHLGALLAGGGEIPDGKGGVIAAKNEAKDYMSATLKNWVSLTNQVKVNPVSINTEKGEVKIPLLLGVDAVHGDYNVLGRVLYPQNISLSMTHDPKLLETMNKQTADDVLESGFNWVYAPTVAIAHNPNWGRTMETLGSELSWVERDARAMVEGLQQVKNGKITGVLATVKHFVGDGATWNGIDEGNDHVEDLNRFLSVNMAGYRGALNASVGSTMISYSAINELPMSLNNDLITNVLHKKTIYSKTPFTGLTVSDYGAIDKAANQGLPTTNVHLNYADALATSINSGMDLVMLTDTSKEYKTVDEFLKILKEQVRQGAIPMSRINEAVTHILAVKYAMGLIDLNSASEYVRNTNYKHKISQKEKIETAMKAAEESFVLLKNKNSIIPLRKNIQYVVLLGEDIIEQKYDDNTIHTVLYQNFNNIGAQNGGWTIAWQGIEGNTFWEGKNKKISGATSLLDGIKNIVPQAKILYPDYFSNTNMIEIQQTRQQFMKQLLKDYPDMTAKNTVIIGTLAEKPYAEFMGDIANPYCIDSNDVTNGCLYNLHLNPYLPAQQKATLKIDYDNFSKNVIEQLEKDHPGLPIVSVLLSGRPMIINQNNGPFATSDALVAAWLPGTSGGQAIANALFGDYRFCNGVKKQGSHVCQTNSPNTLSLNWMNNMKQLINYPIYKSGKGYTAYLNPLFPIGYGLAT